MTTKFAWAIRFFAVALALASALVLVTTARADDQPTSRPARGAAGAGAGQRRGQQGQFLERLHKAVTALNLTDEQKPKIESAFSDAKSKIQEAMKGGAAGGNREAIGEKIKPIFQDLMKTVHGILTEEQQAELKKSLAALGQGRGAGNGKAGAAKNPNNN